MGSSDSNSDFSQHRLLLLDSIKKLDDHASQIAKQLGDLSSSHASVSSATGVSIAALEKARSDHEERLRGVESAKSQAMSSIATAFDERMKALESARKDQEERLRSVESIKAQAVAISALASIVFAAILAAIGKAQSR